MRKKLLLCLMVLLWAGGVQAQTPDAFASSDNDGILRWSSGKFIFREGEDKRMRGYEEWRMTVAPDGSRVLSMWYAIPKDKLSTFAVYRVDSEFRPQALYKTSRVGETLTDVMSNIDGLDIKTRVQVNDQVFRQDMTAKQPFSIVSSPIAADALHFARYDFEKGGEQDWLILGTVAAGAEESDIGVRLDVQEESIGMKIFQDVTIEYLGEEEVSVPAGRFTARHFRMGDVIDMWVHGPDYTLVKYHWHPNQYYYELVEYAAGP